MENTTSNANEGAPVECKEVLEIKEKVALKGNEIRDLKAKKAPKEEIMKLVNDLLELKKQYKEVTGQDFPSEAPKKEKKPQKSKKAEVQAADPNKKSKKQLNKEKKKAAKQEKKSGSNPSPAAETVHEEKKPAAPVSNSAGAKKEKSGKRSSIPLTSLGSIPAAAKPEIRFTPSSSPRTVPVISYIVASLLKYPSMGDGTLFKLSPSTKVTMNLDILPALVLPEGHVINGDYSIARYLISTGDAENTSGLLGFDTISTSQINSWLEFANAGINACDWTKISCYLNEYLKLRTYFVGHQITLADIALYAAAKSLVQDGDDIKNELPHFFRWFSHLNSMDLFSTATSSLNSLGSASVEVSTNSKSGKPVSQASKGKPTKKDDSTGSCPPLKGAKEGMVCTRFPPEPSGYLHIGHVKACMLNNYYARRYNGKLIVRFDDTNPSKEKEEFESSILEDLDMLDIHPDQVTYSSDSFDLIHGYAVQIIKDNLAYMDNTNQERMREERMDGIDSKNRDTPVEKNLELFDAMCKNNREKYPDIDTYCLRAKIDMQAKNKTMRDPVIYRQNLTPHHRTGTKYKAYPTYDFCCPIVDSCEGVTHALRTTEYNDRDEQYQWMIKTLGLRPVTIQAFARVNFVYSVLSKRKLTWFVDNKHVTGWDDPRFPTVRGVLRRGVTVDALRSFILSQGFSRRIVDMEWDKFWVINKKMIDEKAPRYFGIVNESKVKLELTDIESSEPIGLRVDMHPKIKEMGQKVMRFQRNLIVEREDANLMTENEEVTLMRYGNIIIKKIVREADGSISKVQAITNPGGDFKKTKQKIAWLADMPDLVPMDLIEYDFLITKPKLDENDNFKDFINPVTKAETSALGDHGLRNLKKGDVVQLERRGFYKVDSVYLSAKNPLKLIMIPDGKTKAMSTLSTKLAHR